MRTSRGLGVSRRARDKESPREHPRVVIVRMRWHAPSIAYVERRTAEGLSKKEIIRCLKRYLAREIYPHLMADLKALQTT